jgi:dTDP-4-amino-4,6-dideoxygalactose transaminase
MVRRNMPDRSRVIEDAAEGIGVHFDGHHVGKCGLFPIFVDKTIAAGEDGFAV